MTVKKGLDTDQIIKSLRTRYIGKELLYFKSTGSTNLEASEAGKKRSPEGTLVIADKQTQGKGRLGRSWISPPFANLYFSVLLRPRISPQTAGWINLLASVSLVKSIQSSTGLVPDIKWPNDIMVNEKKLGGILTELHLKGDQIDYLVLGIGINVNMGRFPALISKTATSLKKELKHDLHREALCISILEKIEEDLELFYQKGPGTVLSEWEKHSNTLGKSVIVRQPGQTLSGKAIGLDSNGGLMVKTEDGAKVTVMAGDVIHLRTIGET